MSLEVDALRRELLARIEIAHATSVTHDVLLKLVEVRCAKLETLTAQLHAENVTLRGQVAELRERTGSGR